MSESKLRDLSMDFAIDIIELVKHLKANKESIISNQIGRSGTSIGANVRESYNAQSKADFINKLSIALKEANETLYWLELFLESEIITRDEYDSLFQDLDELIALLTSTIKTSKK